MTNPIGIKPEFTPVMQKTDIRSASPMIIDVFEEQNIVRMKSSQNKF